MMEACEKMGPAIFVYDDTFTIRRDRVLEICRQKAERGLKIQWDIRAHINTITDEATPWRRVARDHYGVEAGTKEITKVRKGHRSGLHPRSLH